ncbi:phosphate butyryltransferase [Lentibacillus populi]|uniref:Phosphate butyryltransferase n=1 Tax=Lentibacillus populi TaxID=1827502 RepID=A0A9W5X4D1_9BACI|nr:phosphate butyryltransferase [Lentibacillus populi]GGB34568.1 phosphate butyryltransferase [Lentibacillus populi]
MHTLAELKEQAKRKSMQTVAVANATDVDVLKAIKQVIEEDLCSFLLFGDELKTRSLADSIDLNVTSPQLSIVDETENPGAAAVRAVHQQKASILMKGNISTKDLLTAVLNKECGLRSGNVLSHVALFEFPERDKLLFLTDAAMNIAPALPEKVQIIQNCVHVAHCIGIANPKVAPLAAVEVVNPAMQATIDAASLTQMQRRGQIKGCIIDGPLAFDNAVSRIAADHKQIHSEVAGNADILLVPGIETGNALYKSFMYFAGAKVAAVISGASAPIVLTSRTDTAENKVYSLTLALLASTTF